VSPAEIDIGPRKLLAADPILANEVIASAVMHQHQLLSFGLRPCRRERKEKWGECDWPRPGNIGWSRARAIILSGGTPGHVPPDGG
jgi:hypothetical protein